MQKIPLEKAAEGMILAKPIVRGNGVVLIGEGTELNEQLIERLKGLYISKVTVKGRPLGGEAEKSVEVLNGQYSINIDIPSDMRKKNNYYSADMRFWGDKNNNGIKDKGEPRIACHFIMWGPSAKQVSLKVYEGKKYTIDSPYFNYDYK